MGRFARTRWVNGHWRAEGEDGTPEGVDDSHREGHGDDPSAPSLLVVIHDSDIAAITFSPGPPHGDSFFLGYEPSDYFQDPRASHPVDHRAVAGAFVKWVAEARGVKVSKGAVRALLARPGRQPEDVIVEETVERLLELIGLPAPEYA